MKGLVLNGTYQNLSGQPTGDATFTNGNVGAYPEGACVPALIKVTNKEASPRVDFEIVYDYHKNGNVTQVVGVEDLRPIELTTGVIGDPETFVDNLNDIVFPGWALNAVQGFDSTAGGVSATITGPYGGDEGAAAVADNDTFRHYNVSLSGIQENATAYVLVCAKTGLDASLFPGSSMSVKTGGGGGAGSMPIQGGELLQLPSLTLTKTVSKGSAMPDQWGFNVNPAINGVMRFPIPAGQDSVTIPNVQIEGNYQITETVGPSGYQFESGSGENCTFDGPTATASLHAAKPAADASCTFTNGIIPFVATTGTITVIENVINDDAGTATAQDFTLSLTAGGITHSFPGDAAGTTFVVPAGNYWTSFNAVISGYTPTYSTDCNGDIEAGESLTCTITHDDDEVVIPPGATTGTLTVVKRVINDDGRVSVARDFTLHIESEEVQTDFRGNEGGTLFVLKAGNYSITELADVDYTASFSAGCTGPLVAGHNRICTVTNDDTALPFTATTGTLRVIKNVINDNGRTSQAGDFTLTLTQSTGATTTFLGNASGTTFEVNVGSYSVTEMAASGYAVSYSEECSGDMAANQTLVCTVTNDDTSDSTDPPPFTATTGTVTVIKNVINDNGGTKKANDFSLMLAASGTSPIDFSGNASGTTFVVKAGYYIVSETGLSNYAVSYSEGCSGTIRAKESVVCTVTNDDKANDEDPGEDSTGTLVVVKHMHNVFTVKKASDFTLGIRYGRNPIEVDNALREGAMDQLTEGYATSVRGNENGVSLVLPTGQYTVTEEVTPGISVTYSQGCSGTLAANTTVTCVVDNYEVNGSGGNNGGGGGGAGWTPGIYGGSPAVTSVPEPLPTLPQPRVLGVEDVAPQCILTAKEAEYVTPDTDVILKHLNRSKDVGMEEYYNRVLTPRVVPKDLTGDVLAAVRNFVNYGTLNTVRLGHGERAGAVNSFAAIYGRMPQDVCDWQEVIRLSTTRMPTAQQLRDKDALKTFRAIYSRTPHEESAADRVALKVMAYGIRPQARNIQAEYEASKVFYRIFRKLPETATEWDANRAIAYSGLAHKWLTVDLTGSRILSIATDIVPLALK